jgi:hypothetical protein
MWLCGECHGAYDGRRGKFSTMSISGPVWGALLKTRPEDFHFLSAYDSRRLKEEPKKMYVAEMREHLLYLQKLNGR